MRYEELIDETIKWFQKHGVGYRRRGWDLSFIAEYIHGVVLDLGSGYAVSTRRLLEKGLINRLVLVDLADRVLARISDDPRLVRITADIREYESIHEYFDTILLLASLHNIPGREHRLNVLRSVYRMLKKRGYLVVFVWARLQAYFLPILFINFFRRLLGKIESIGDIIIRGRNSLRYYHLYTMRELIHDITISGFRIVEKGVYYPHRRILKPLKNYYIVAVKD
jgi:SAM-dependent methyltransferase